MVGRFSLALAGWILTSGVSLPGRAGSLEPHDVAETITVFGPNGRAARTATLPRRVIHRASIFQKLEPAQRDTLARIRELILRESSRPLALDRPLRKGRPALMPRRARMSRLLVVLEALGAGSEAEYHRIIARLGVSVTRTDAKDASGGAGVRTDYFVGGKTQVSRFTPSSATGTQDADTPRGGPSAEMAACEWTDDDGIYWSGECASQQQIDDAAALLAATNADINDVAADAANDLTYCQQVLDGCWETNDLLESGDQARGGPSADPVWCASPFNACYSQTVALGLSMAGYYRQAYKLGVLVTAIAPPAGAIFDTAFGLALIAGGAYLAGRALSACLLST